jgi:nucleoside-diphosphate-sugar epimerase
MTTSSWCRLEQVLEPGDLEHVDFIQGDVTDLAAVESALDSCGAGRVIHLAGLQVPFCKADPLAGARVNVLGTLHLFEAAKRRGLERVVYASSAAVYGDEGDAAVDESVVPAPTTHYGVYKQANEGNARVYFQDDGLSSVGLRPLTVYGVARDQGLTSGPTKAMKAAVLGRDYTINFSGRTDFLHTSDAAAAFVEASLRAPAGAHVYNLHGESVDVSDVVARIEAHPLHAEASKIRIDGPALPIAAHLSDGALRAALPGLPVTSLDAGVADTMERFARLHHDGRLPTEDLDA